MPTAEPKKDESEVSPRRLAALAWHDAKTEAERKAAVEKFPILREIYQEAAHLK